MRERTTTELIETLGADIERCHGELISSIDNGRVDQNGDVHADYEYHARQLIRAIFAFIEAVTFSMKVKSAERCMRQKRPLSDAERFLAVDIEHILTDKGEVIERPAHTRLSDNIRFAFRLSERVVGVAEQFDPSTEWWSCLKSSIRVRDRLTHPKLPEDIDISGDEILAALKAYEGFSNQAMHYAAQRSKAKRSKVKKQMTALKASKGKGKSITPKGERSRPQRSGGNRDKYQ